MRSRYTQSRKGKKIEGEGRDSTFSGRKKKTEEQEQGKRKEVLDVS